MRITRKYLTHMTTFEFNNVDLKAKAERLKYVFDELVKQKKKFENIISTRGLKSEEHEQYVITCSKLNNFNEKCKNFIRPRKNGVGKFSVKDYITWCQNNNSPGIEYGSNSSNTTNICNNGMSNMSNMTNMSNISNMSNMSNMFNMPMSNMPRNSEASTEKVFFGHDTDSKYKEGFMNNANNAIFKECGNGYEVYSTSSNDNKSDDVKGEDKDLKQDKGIFGGRSETYGKMHQSPQGYYGGGVYGRHRGEEKKMNKMGYRNGSMGWEFHNSVGNGYYRSPQHLSGDRRGMRRVEGDGYYYRTGNHGMMHDNEFYPGNDMDRMGYGKHNIGHERDYGTMRNGMTSPGLNINVAGMNLDGYLNEAQDMLSPRMSPGLANGYGYRGAVLNDRGMNSLLNANPTINMSGVLNDRAMNPLINANMNMMNDRGMNMSMGYDRGRKRYGERDMEMGYGWMYNSNESQKMLEGGYTHGGFGRYNKPGMMPPGPPRGDATKRPLLSDFFVDPKYENRVMGEEYSTTNEIIGDDEPLDTLLNDYGKPPEAMRKKWTEKTWRGSEDSQFVGNKSIGTRSRSYSKGFTEGMAKPLYGECFDGVINPLYTEAFDGVANSLESAGAVNRRAGTEQMTKTNGHKRIGALLVQKGVRHDLCDVFGKNGLELVDNICDFLLLHGDAVLHRICMLVCEMASLRVRRYVTLEDIKAVFLRLFEATGIDFHDDPNAVMPKSSVDFTEFNNIIELIEKDRDNY